MDYTYLVFDDETMKHHGVKGMHWGIRRYQNPDGSWKPEGRKRYKKELRADKQKYQDARDAAVAYRAGADFGNKYLKRAEKRYAKAKIKDPHEGNKSTMKKRWEVERHRKNVKAFEKASKESLKKAQKFNKEFINKYGDKEISTLKYDKQGRLKDNKKAERLILNTLSYLGAAGVASVTGFGIAQVQRGPADSRSYYEQKSKYKAEQKEKRK